MPGEEAIQPETTRHPPAARLRAALNGSAAPESYRRLALQLDADLGSSAERGHCLLLTAADPSFEITDAAIQLALVLADELAHPVLLIDGDFSGHGLSDRLHAPVASGWRGDMRGADAGALIQPTDHPLVSLLAAGSHSSGLGAGPGPGASSPVRDFADVLREARARHRHILICAPSIAEDDRGLLFASMVDRVLLFVVEGKTLVDEVDECRRALQSCKAAPIGIVLTKPRRRWWGR